MSFGEKLQILRRGHNLTQEQFAEQLKVSRQAVSKWESSKGFPEIEKIIYICNQYGVTMDELFADEVPIHGEEQKEETQNPAAEQPLKNPRLLDSFTNFFINLTPTNQTIFTSLFALLVLGGLILLSIALTKGETNQMMISTHSEDFLQGLLDAENRNVTVIRIHRENNINKMNILKNESIQELWGKPLLRYSNILSGLFHQKVVVCESDYDCLFYQAILNAIYEQKNEIAPDVLFTHCGGKDRIKDVVKALKAVNVPVVAICDFDLLNNRQTFQAISQAFGLNWDIELSAEMTVIYDYMNGKSNGGQKAWAEIKQTGKSGFSGKAYLAYDRVETMCRVKGLFVVPVGEMECFDKTILKEKKEWVYHVLENYNLAVEPNLKGAREFVQNIIDY